MKKHKQRFEHAWRNVFDEGIGFFEVIQKMEKEGWELVAIDEQYLYFKRPV